MVVFRGMCDASGAVVLSEWLFAVADDEDNILRVYDGRVGGEPVYMVDVSPHLRLQGKSPEMDLEAATRTSNHAFWLTSHGRSSSGKERPNRLRLFATNVPREGVGLQVVGEPYLRLLEDLLAAPQLAGMGLAEAAKKAPKEPGGLSIEGMTAMPSGDVFIGFRNPLHEGRAIVISVGNLEGTLKGERVSLGTPYLLDLGGRGVRSISSWRGTYLLIGGSVTEGGAPMLFTWDGKSDRPQAVPIDLSDVNPEAFVTYEDKTEFLLLSDDGSREIGGKRCKKLPAAEKQFRGLWVTLP